MAGRSIATGRILWFTGCAESAERVAGTYPSAVVERVDGVCPTHGGTDCLTAFYSREYVGSWSLGDLLRMWRRARRAARQTGGAS